MSKNPKISAAKTKDVTGKLFCRLSVPLGKSIDRYPNKNGNHEPENCRWATQSEQIRNRRTAAQVKADSLRMEA